MTGEVHMSTHVVSANAQLHQDRVRVAQIFTLQQQQNGIKTYLAKLTKQNLKFRSKKTDVRFISA